MRRALGRIFPSGIALSLLLAAAWPANSPAEDALERYIDEQYQFAFQFPADWTLENNPRPGEAGDVRAIVRHPTHPVRAIASVSQIGKSVTKQQYEAAANRDATVQAMMEVAIKQIYQPTSRQLGAQRMLMGERRVMPSTGGIRFYISTVHMVGDAKLVVAGVHIVPFEKPYMVTFIMISPLDPTAAADAAAINRVVNSFHVIGEQPLNRPESPAAP